jgi:flagellar hook-associated protein 3 FlgL
MKTSFVSNLAVQNAMRLTIQQGQAELLKLQTEVTTGRHADVGLALGSSAARSVSLQRGGGGSGRGDGRAPNP